ncbi:hypothetical protein [Rubrivivax albus]|nr:hypothetical protein [Rubrivivax albus]
MRPPGLWALMLRPPALKAALRIAAVVGTVLNAVNNGPPWWAGEPVSAWKVVMNYVVPLCVASYSAARQEQRRLAASMTPAPGLHEDRSL